MNSILNKLFSIVLFSTLFTVGFFADSSYATGNEQLFFNDNTNLQEYLETNFDLQLQEKKFSFKPSDFATWKIDFTLEEEYYSEIEKSTLCQDGIFTDSNIDNSLIDKYFSICDLTKTINSIENFKKGAILKIDEQKVEQFVSTLSEKVFSLPKNAKVQMKFEDNIEITGGNTEKNTAKEDQEKLKGELEIITPAESGFSLDEETTTEIILTALQKSQEERVFQLPMKEEKPKISKETLSELKINDQIGHGESNFAGSPKNRIYNINLATNKFNGILLSPGEEFSFVTILGPVEKETGYKEELVIKDNKTIPEYGGGVCQVSTTVFRAALNTGLKITERQNHSYPVQYYNPQGTDATIYLPNPDLKFINNTPGYILFQPSIEGNKLTFDFFGESDNRKVEIEGPKVTERTSEGVLKIKLKQIVTDANGKLIFEDTFNSVYDNPAKYHETEILKIKPDNWSVRQWNDYKKSHNM